MSNTLPVPLRTETEMRTAAVELNGLRAGLGVELHCVAAEPFGTFLRVAVSDGGQEVAYETVVLGRLRRGYRVLHLRSMLGTRIELCFLFVRISCGTVPNQWATPRQLRIQSSRLQDTITQRLKPHIEAAVKLKKELAMLKAQSSTELVTDNSDSTDVSNEGSLSQLRTQGGSQDALFPPRPRGTSF